MVEEGIQALAVFGSTGKSEVPLRLVGALAIQAAAQPVRAQEELRETLRQIKLRADGITDPFWQHSYLAQNAHCARAQQLAQEWGIDIKDLKAAQLQ